MNQLYLIHSYFVFRYAMICSFHKAPSTILSNSKSLVIKFFETSWRSFSDIDTSPSSLVRNAQSQTIHTETLNITNKGRLEVRCPFNLHITPIHPKDFPRLDKAFFTIYGMNNKS